MKKDERKSVETIIREELGNKILIIIDTYLENNKKIYDKKIKGDEVRATEELSLPDGVDS